MQIPSFMTKTATNTISGSSVRCLSPSHPEKYFTGTLLDHYKQFHPEAYREAMNISNRAYYNAERLRNK